MCRSFFGLVCFLIFTIPVMADDWDDAITAYDAGHYEEAISLLEPLAKKGMVKAQNKLADIYWIERDDDAAFYWTQQALDQGDLSAQVTMAHNYLQGRGVSADDELAVHWFSVAAARGDSSALYDLAVLTMKGVGTEADPTEAIRLFREAAELDHPFALYALGGIYFDGDYVAGNLKLSVKYLRRAAELRQRRAMVLLGLILEEMPEAPGNWTDAVLYYQAAIAEGCDDVDELAREAAKHLSAGEWAGAEQRLADWQAAHPSVYMQGLGHCISDVPMAM